MPSLAEKRITPRFTEAQRRMAYFCALKRSSDANKLAASSVDRTTSELAISPETLHLATADIRHLSAIIAQLVDLRNEEESDEYGTLRATSSAFRRACEYLTDAAIVSAQENGGIIPYGSASTDSEGGIRIEWVGSTSGVRLIVPASAENDPYIYHEVGDLFDIEPATAEGLAHWLGQIA